MMISDDWKIHRSTGWYRPRPLLWLVVGFCLWIMLPAFAMAESSVLQSSPAVADNDRNVMEGFKRYKIILGEAVKISDQRKHTVLFIMGALLLTLIITTASLGVAMVIHGKQVFVHHMVFAGFTVTLAIAHAIASMVWFFPF